MGYGSRKLQGPRSPDDLEALPESIVGESIEGTIYTHARPRPGHGLVEGRLFGGLDGPFQIGRGGPGGWWIETEPGIQLDGPSEFIPDLAGWRRERVPGWPERWTVVPDWACEILSLTTRGYDQRIKRPFYARIGIRHLWYIDLDARILTVSELSEGRWVELGVYGEDDAIRAAPFDAIELKLGELWPPTRTS